MVFWHTGTVSVKVVPYSQEWPQLFDDIAERLRDALRGFPLIGIEHVGSTSVPGLAAKPIIDVDIIARREFMAQAIDALATAGYEHRGNLGLVDREAFFPPDDIPPRNVYLCVVGTLHLRNHMAVRDALRASSALRDRYGAIKTELASDPTMTIERYLAGKSAMLQDILAVSDLTTEEKRQVYELNTKL